MYETLIDASSTDITRLANHTVNDDEKRRSLVMPFRPVVEEMNHVDAFIKEHPLKILKQKDFLSGIPIITVSIPTFFSKWPLKNKRKSLLLGCYRHGRHYNAQRLSL